MTVNEIWKALEQNKKVYWNNKLYKVHSEKVESINKYNSLSLKNGYALRITCISNYFGGWIAESELKDVFIDNN